MWILKCYFRWMLNTAHLQVNWVPEMLCRDWILLQKGQVELICICFPLPCFTFQFGWSHLPACFKSAVPEHHRWLETERFVSKCTWRLSKREQQRLRVGGWLITQWHILTEFAVFEVDCSTFFYKQVSPFITVWEENHGRGCIWLWDLWQWCQYYGKPQKKTVKLQYLVSHFIAQLHFSGFLIFPFGSLKALQSFNHFTPWSFFFFILLSTNK